MRKAKTFRPTIGDTLEDRTVPSGGVDGGGWLTGLIGLAPSQATRQVRQAFQTFEQAYANDVWTVLYGTGGPSAASRTAFDAKVGTDLQTLEASIHTALGAGNPALTAAIDDALTGSASTSLQNELKAIPTPTATSGRGFWASAWRFLGQGEADIDQTARSVSDQVQKATTPAKAIGVAQVWSVLSSVNTAFKTFASSYYNDARTILYKAGTTPAAQRAAFNTAVANDIKTLTDSVTGALTTAGFPTSLVNSLTTTLTKDLQTPGTGADGSSLQEQLAAVKTPDANNWFSKAWFRFNSSSAIGSAQVKIYSDVISAVKAYNSSLTTA